MAAAAGTGEGAETARRAVLAAGQRTTQRGTGVAVSQCETEAVAVSSFTFQVPRSRFSDNVGAGSACRLGTRSLELGTMIMTSNASSPPSGRTGPELEKLLDRLEASTGTAHVARADHAVSPTLRAHRGRPGEDHDLLVRAGDAALPGKPRGPRLRRNSRNARAPHAARPGEMVLPDAAADVPAARPRVLPFGGDHAGRLRVRRAGA